jgi:hypothetical protein
VHFQPSGAATLQGRPRCPHELAEPLVGPEILFALHSVRSGSISTWIPSIPVSNVKCLYSMDFSTVAPTHSSSLATALQSTSYSLHKLGSGFSQAPPYLEEVFVLPAVRPQQGHPLWPGLGMQDVQGGQNQLDAHTVSQGA